MGNCWFYPCGYGHGSGIGYNPDAQTPGDLWMGCLDCCKDALPLILPDHPWNPISSYNPITDACVTACIQLAQLFAKREGLLR